MIWYNVPKLDVIRFTISYKEAINRVKSFIDIKESNLLSLDVLGKTRNKITYFGVYRELIFMKLLEQYGFHRLEEAALKNNIVPILGNLS